MCCLVCRILSRLVLVRLVLSCLSYLVSSRLTLYRVVLSCLVLCKRIRDFHGLCLSGAHNVPIVRYIEVPGTCTGHRYHRHLGDIEGEDLEIGAVDKLLVGELGG